MTAAAVGLVGVVIGAVLSGGIQWMLQRRSDNRSAMSAARLVTYELWQYRELLGYQIRNRYWETGLWFHPVRWREFQARLSVACTGSEWQQVTFAYMGIETVDSWHAPTKDGAEPNVERDPEQSSMPAILETVVQAMEALTRLSKAGPDVLSVGGT